MGNERGFAPRRVVITGLGVVSPLGIGWKEYWQGLLEGRSGVRRIDRFDVSDYPSKIAGMVPEDFNPADFIDRKKLRRMDRYTVYGMVATRLALEDSGLKLEDEDPWRIGVYLASGVGGLETFEEETRKLIAKGPKGLSPFFVPKFIANILSGWVSIEFGIKGPSLAHVSACSSSASAIGEAFNAVRYGMVDVAVVGGSEAPITPTGLGGFCAMKALSFKRNDEPEKASRPFDADRDGFVLAEGSGVLVIEELEHALRRGANIYAEIVGYGATSDAYHITAPHPEAEGIAKAIAIALEDAGIKPEEVGYVNAHGTSTALNDKVETMGLKKVFGEHAYKLKVSSTKSMIGHTLGAAGALETIATALSLRDGVLHPTINRENPDEECDLDYVTEGKVNVPNLRYAIKNSLGFGGHNVVLVLKKFEGN